MNKKSIKCKECGKPPFRGALCRDCNRAYKTASMRRSRAARKAMKKASKRCSCGVLISENAAHCRKCFELMQKKRRKRTPEGIAYGRRKDALPVIVPPTAVKRAALPISRWVDSGESCPIRARTIDEMRKRSKR